MGKQKHSLELKLRCLSHRKVLLCYRDSLGTHACGAWTPSGLGWASW